MPLLSAVMARLTKGLKVVRIPEQANVATVRADVVASELARVCLYASTPWHLAGEQVPPEHVEAQACPSLGPIPLAPMDCGLPMLTHGGQALWQRWEAGVK